MTKCYAPLVVLLVLLCSPVFGQKPSIRFLGLNSEDPVAQCRINTLSTDGKGFIWMAAESELYRFDGVQTVPYRHDPLISKSLAWGRINKLFTDREGQVWIALGGGGLCKFQDGPDRFIRYDLGGDTDPSLNIVTDIAQDSAGQRMWLATQGGLLLFEPDKKSVTPVLTRNKKTQAVQTLFCDSSGVLWFAQGQQLHTIAAMDTQPKRFILPGASSQVNCFSEDRSGRLWLGTNTGLMVLGKGARQAEEVIDEANWPGFPGNITSICEDDAGRIWIGSYLQGLTLLPEWPGKTYYTFNHQVSDPWSLGTPNVWDIYRDPKGNLWLGTDQGPRWLPAINSRLMHYRATGDSKGLIDSQIWSFYQDTQSDIWLGSDQGLARWLEVEGRFEHFLPHPKQPEDVAANRVRAICQDNEGDFWVGGRKDLYRFHPEKGFFRTYRSNEKVLVGSMRSIIKDGSGNLWFGSFHGGLLRYDPDSDKLVTYQNQEGQTFPKVRHLKEGRNGLIWVASQDGLCVINPVDNRSWKLASFRGKPLTVMGLLQTADHIWAATADDVLRFDPIAEPKELTATRFGDSMKATQFYGLLEQDATHLWVSSNKGIFRLNPDTGEALQYRHYHGLQGDDFASGSFLRDSNGRLFFGGPQGFNVFSPESMQQTSKQSPLVLTSLMLQYKKILPGQENGILTNALSQTRSLTLSHHQKVISLSFASLEFTAPKHTEYAYILDGFDEQWTITQAPVRSAVYTNLDHGKYLFKVKASNSLGNLNNAHLEVELRVKPAPWNTVLARFVYLLLLLAAFLLVLRYRSKELARERHHWQALEEKNKEILRAQSQLVMQEKMASVGLLTAGIAHEIKNPTTFTRISAQNLATDMADFQVWLLELGGEEAAVELKALLQERMAGLFDHIDLIREGSARIVNLAQNLQNFSRVDSGTQEVTLTEGILSTLNLVRAKFKEQTVFQTEFEDDLRTWCRPGQMNQVYMNLIVNACQEMRSVFTKTGQKGVLTIQTRREGDWDYIKFRDTGDGMTSEIASHVFEPFFTTKEATEGTGLGLAITLRIVREHGGSIDLVTSPGKGSTFIVKLPTGGKTKHSRPDTIPGVKIAEMEPGAN